MMILFGRNTLPSAPLAGKVVSLLQFSVVHQHIVSCQYFTHFHFQTCRVGRKWATWFDEYFGQHFNIITNRTQICFVGYENLSSPIAQFCTCTPQTLWHCQVSRHFPCLVGIGCVSARTLQLNNRRQIGCLKYATPSASLTHYSAFGSAGKVQS